MSRLASAIQASTNRDARTNNGAVTLKTSLSPLVDLFFIAGAARGKDISHAFASSFAADEDLSLRLALWLRDVREGAGEREQFRNFFRWLINNHRDGAVALLNKIPELGRWDDALIGLGSTIHAETVSLIRAGLAANDGLLMKWLPRKGPIAVQLRTTLGMSPKQYRKTLVNGSKTVEQAMCARDWTAINFSHVPSVAFSRYKKAFNKHAPEAFANFITKVKNGEAKINAGAIFPHDIIRTLRFTTSKIEAEASYEQWKALPDYLAETNERVLVMCDSSGSMGSNGNSVAPIDVAIALSIYMSERLTGVFKDTFLTFSRAPELQLLTGTLGDRIRQLASAQWDQNTDLQAAFNLILNTAINNSLDESDMPTKVIIISDMEFDASGGNRTNFEIIRAKYAASGYKMPDVVFWNVAGRIGNMPVTQHQNGTALISGFSPSILKGVLGQSMLTPEEVMLQTLLNDRYNY
jgi:hypothetical protein